MDGATSSRSVRRLGEADMFRYVLVFLCILAIVLLAFRLLDRPASKPRPKGGSRVRPTREGWLFGLFALGVLASALHTGVNLIYLTFSVLASALLLSCALAAIAGARASAERSMPKEVVAGERFRVRVSLRNTSSWMPIYCLSVDHQWPGGLICEFRKHLALRMRPNRDLSFHFPAIASRRGWYDLANCSFGTGFPFGFFERRGQASGPGGRMLALPRLGRLKWRWSEHGAGKSTAMKRNLSPSHIEDFYGIREYRPGDNPSWIHWKMTARHQKPMVRELGSYQRERVLLALCAVRPKEAGPDEKEDLEKAISFAATLAQDICRSNNQIGFVAFAKEPAYRPPSSGTAHFHEIWRALAAVEPCEQNDCERFLQLPYLAIEDYDRVILVTSGPQCHECRILFESVTRAGGRLESFRAGSEAFERSFELPPTRAEPLEDPSEPEL